MTTPFAPQILSPKPTRRRALNLEITALPTCHIFVLNFQKEFYFTSKRLIEQLKSCALFLTRVPTSKISCAIRRSTTEDCAILPRAAIGLRQGGSIPKLRIEKFPFFQLFSLL